MPAACSACGTLTNRSARSKNSTDDATFVPVCDTLCATYATSGGKPTALVRVSARDPTLIMLRADNACLATCFLTRPLAEHAQRNGDYLLPRYVVEPVHAYYAKQSASIGWPLKEGRDHHHDDDDDDDGGSAQHRRKRQAQELSALESMPDEILVDILRRLTLQQLLSTARVNKRFYDLIMHRHLFRAALADAATVHKLDAALLSVARANMHYPQSMILEIMFAYVRAVDAYEAENALGRPLGGGMYARGACAMCEVALRLMVDVNQRPLTAPEWLDERVPTAVRVIKVLVDYLSRLSCSSQSIAWRAGGDDLVLYFASSSTLLYRYHDSPPPPAEQESSSLLHVNRYLLLARLVQDKLLVSDKAVATTTESTATLAPAQTGFASALANAILVHGGGGVDALQQALEMTDMFSKMIVTDKDDTTTAYHLRMRTLVTRELATQLTNSLISGWSSRSFVLQVHNVHTLLNILQRLCTYDKSAEGAGFLNLTLMSRILFAAVDANLSGSIIHHILDRSDMRMVIVTPGYLTSRAVDKNFPLVAVTSLLAHPKYRSYLINTVPRDTLYAAVRGLYNEFLDRRRSRLGGQGMDATWVLYDMQRFYAFFRLVWEAFMSNSTIAAAAEALGLAHLDWDAAAYLHSAQAAADLDELLTMQE